MKPYLELGISLLVVLLAMLFFALFAETDFEFSFIMGLMVGAASWVGWRGVLLMQTSGKDSRLWWSLGLLSIVNSLAFLGCVFKPTMDEAAEWTSLGIAIVTGGAIIVLALVHIVLLIVSPPSVARPSRDKAAPNVLLMFPPPSDSRTSGDKTKL